jgi:hypothetical protein
MITDSIERPFTSLLLLLLLLNVTSMSVFLCDIKIHSKLHDSKLLEQGIHKNVAPFCSLNYFGETLQECV